MSQAQHARRVTESASAPAVVDALLDAIGSLGDPPGDPEHEPDHEELVLAVRGLHECNARLWDREDDARRAHATDAEIGAIKRVIDVLNLRRHGYIEAVDDALLTALPQSEDGVSHTETPGLIVDRLSVLTLRVHHTTARAKEKGTDEEHRLEAIRGQLTDLREALRVLLHQSAEGRIRFRTYRAHKVYGKN
ncbi:DUF4254 domain-containing protein [Actinomadura roseirufa]|uniref:DUF4254 domain-containing protein n=1 Tax=Actinomadura roseirufa TaxID=2094049 RepID=UPI00104176E1|nr:DUF4254 domain-containing protein [Actinomadura roseirufa]